MHAATPSTNAAPTPRTSASTPGASAPIEVSPFGTRPLAPSAEALHDIRNLLQGLYLYVGLLKQPGVLADRHRHYADELDEIADRCATLLNGPPVDFSANDPADRIQSGTAREEGLYEA